MGARPLKRLVQQVVVNRLARMLLEGRLRPGDAARLEVQGGELSIRVESVQ